MFEIVTVWLQLWCSKCVTSTDSFNILPWNAWENPSVLNMNKTENSNFLVLKSFVSGLIGISSCSMKSSMSQILLSIYGVFTVCWVNALGRQIRNLVSVLTLRISVRRETMRGSYVLGYWKEVVAGLGRMPKLFRWLMSPWELWADCVFSEWDWDLFLLLGDFGMLLWF